MNWDSIPLHDVLQISKVYLPVLENELYPYAALHPYPNGLSPKGHKKGSDLRTKQRKTIRTGQFVISKTHIQQRCWGIVQPELDGAVIHRSCLSFELHPALNTNYFAAYLATSVFRKAVLAACTKKARLDVRQFGRISIPLPPVDDQVRIARTWESAYKTLKHTADMYTSITELKAGIATDLFQKATASSECKPLGRCAIIGDDVSANDAIYITMMGKFLRARPHSGEAVLGLVPETELDGHFVRYFLESHKSAWYTAAGNSLMGLITALQALQIPLPVLYEQRKISSVLQQHDDVLQKLKTEHNELWHLIQGMMHQIFSGNLPPVEAISLLQTI